MTLFFESFQFDIKDIEENLFLNKNIDLDSEDLNILNIPEYIKDSISFYGTFSISYRKMIELILNDNDINFLDLCSSVEFGKAYYVLKKIRRIVENKDSILDISEFIENNWKDHKEFLKLYIERDLKRVEEFIEFINDVFNDNISKYNFNFKEDIVSKHIKAELEIDKALKEFGPSEITDNYSAGWLCPDGTFFGLNGEVSNLLHITLANEIFKYYKWPDPDGQSKDWYLDDRGFVKIHGNSILFSGYSYELLGRASRKLTQRQIDKIYEYGKKCWGGVLQFGYSKTPLNVDKFIDFSDTELRDLFIT